MTVRKDQVNVTVLIDGKQAINQLGLLEMEAQDIRTSMKGMRKDSDDFVTSSKKLNQVTGDIGKMRDQIGLTGMTMTQLRSAQRDLNKEINNVTAGTPQYNALKNKIQEVNGVIHQQQTEIRGVGKASEEMSMSMSMLVGGLLERGIEKGIEFIKDFGAEAIKAFEEADQATAQLEASLHSTGGAAGLTKEEIMNLSSELQELTNIDHNLTNVAASLLLTFTNVKDKAFKEAIPLIQDMAVKLAGGNNGTIDLKSAAEKVGKALNDPTNGMTALKKAGVSLSEEQKNTIAVMQATGNIAGAQSIILAELNKKFGGSAQAAAEAGSSIMRYKIALHELQEIVGGRMKENFELMAQSMLVMVNSAREFLEIPLSDKLSEEQNELNGLVIAIQNTNDNQEIRNKLIGDLQTKYPDFLKNLDKENVTNEQLGLRLAEVNKQYVNRIVLQRQEEAIQDQAKDQADILEDLIEQEKSLGRALAIRQEISGLTKKQNETIDAFLKRSKSNVSKKVGDEEETVSYYAVAVAQDKINNLQKKYNEASKEGNALIKDRMDLEKKLGLDSEKNSSDEIKNDKAAQDAIVDYRKLTKKQLQVIAKGTGEFSDEANAATAELKRRADLKKELDHRQADELAATKNIEALKLSLFGKTLDDETAKLREKAANDIAIVKGTESQKAQQILLINKKLDQDLIQLNSDYEAKALKLVMDGRGAEAQYDKDLQTKAFNGKLAINDVETLKAKGKNKKILDLHIERLEIERKKELASAEQTGADVKVINDKYDELEKQAKKAAILASNMLVLQEAQKTLQAFSDLSNAITQEKISKEEAAKNIAIANLDKELASKKLSEINYTAQKEKISKQYDDKINELKNKQAKKDHDAAVLQAGLAAAMAVINALAQGGPYYALAVGIIAAASVAAIAAKPIPKYAEGGFTTFAQGGHVNGATLGLIGEAGPEYVVSNPMMKNPMVANFVGMMENMRNARAFANGGFTTSNTLPASTTFTPAPKNPSYESASAPTGDGYGQMLAELRAIKEALNSFEGRIHVAYTDIEKSGETVDKIRQAATIK